MKAFSYSLDRFRRRARWLDPVFFGLALGVGCTNVQGTSTDGSATGGMGGGDGDGDGDNPGDGDGDSPGDGDGDSPGDGDGDLPGDGDGDGDVPGDGDGDMPGDGDGDVDCFGDAPECMPWTTCEAGTSVSSEPSESTDRTCEVCPMGTYSDSENAAACTSCPDGSLAPEEGSSSCSPWVQLDAGSHHTCGVLAGGSVRCWGNGADGRLGYGNIDNVGNDSDPPLTSDVDVGGVVKQISAGAQHTCVVLESGAVRCWGAGAFGRLGYGNTEPIGDTETPSTAGDIQITGRVAQISAGEQHTCALLESGAVRCWGRDGGYGRLGVLDAPLFVGDDETPDDSSNVLLVTSAQQISVGLIHTCALLVDGTVRCWGEGGWGQLGLASLPADQIIGNDEVPASSPALDFGVDVLQIGAGQYHTCALLETGSVRCWGTGSQGQLGYPMVADIFVATDATDIDLGGTATQIAVGANHTCALLDDGAVRCWGEGDDGRLGYGDVEDVGDDETPASMGDVAIGAPAVEITAGREHTCATLITGAVRCWGSSEFGQLGYGNEIPIGDTELPAEAGDVPLQ